LSHRFNPQHLDRLLSEEREKSLPPSWVWDALTVQNGNNIADVGAGPGYFALPAARLTKGTVYAVDVEPAMLEALKGRAQAAGLENISLVEGNAQAIALSDQAVDRTLCAFVLHEVDDLAVALRELQRITKKGGLIGLLEWEKKPTNFGPPIADRLSAEELEQAMRAIGMTQITSSKPNDDQYMLICTV